jgi:type IV pilus assembly protein PilC
MEFTYTAINQQGQNVQERIHADDEKAALKRLHGQGNVVLSLGPAAKARGEKAGGGGGFAMPALALPFGKRRVKLEQLTTFSRELAIMIETGVSITDALLTIQEHADNPVIGEALLATHDALAGGSTITQALGAYPHIFPKIYVSMVRTAEVGGNLAQALEQGADYLEVSLEMRRKVKGAMTYPVVLLVVACLVMVFMLTYLIPQFSELFARMNVALPPSTRFLIVLSGLLRTHFWLIPIVPFALITGWRNLMRVPSAKMAVTRLSHRIPILGDTIKKVAMARILRALGTLMECGVPLMIVLETVEEVSGDMVFAQAMASVRQRVEGGIPLSEAFISTGAFAPMVCQMMVVGEKSGRLSPILSRVALYFEREVDTRLKSLTSILEPLMIILLGFVVGFIAISIITPIYTLVTGVK